MCPTNQLVNNKNTPTPNFQIKINMVLAPGGRFTKTVREESVSYNIRES